MAKIEFGGSGLQEAASLRRAADRKEKQARDLLSSHEDQPKCDEQMKAFEPRLHFAIFFDLSFPMIFGQLSMIVFHVSEFQSSLAYWKMSPLIPALHPLPPVGCSWGFHAEDEHVKQFCKDIQPAFGNGSLSKLTHVKDVDPIQMAEERAEQNLRNQVLQKMILGKGLTGKNLRIGLGFLQLADSQTTCL